MLLPGCATGQQTPQTAPTTVVVHDCIGLEPPPVSVVDAIATAAQTDPEAGHWVIALEKHYQAIESCQGKR